MYEAEFSQKAPLMLNCALEHLGRGRRVVGIEGCGVRKWILCYCIEMTQDSDF